jgi:hypothetical protein
MVLFQENKKTLHSEREGGLDGFGAFLMEIFHTGDTK